MELYLHEQQASLSLLSTDIQCNMATFCGGYELTSGLVMDLAFCTAESDVNNTIERCQGPTSTNVIRRECQTHLPANVNWLHKSRYITGNLGKSDACHRPLTPDSTSLLCTKALMLCNAAICMPSFR